VTQIITECLYLNTLEELMIPVFRNMGSHSAFMFKVRQSRKTTSPSEGTMILRNVRNYSPNMREDWNLQQHCCKNLKSCVSSFPFRHAEPSCHFIGCEI